MTDPQMERRRFRRFLRSLPMDYEIERDRQWLPGKGQLITINVGLGGAKIRLEEELHEGDYVRLAMQIDDRKLTTVGRVVWVEASRMAGRTLAGVQFEQLEAEAESQLRLALADVPADPG